MLVLLGGKVAWSRRNSPIIRLLSGTPMPLALICRRPEARTQPKPPLNSYRTQ